MVLRRVNRINKRKNKKSSGCGLCKPHKHGGRAMRDKDRLILRGLLKGMDTTIDRDNDRV